MNSHTFPKLLGLSLAALTALNCDDENRKAAETSENPNILFILTNDLGWANVGYHGSEIQPPNIDELAEIALQLTQHYVMSTSTHTRVRVITGRGQCTAQQKLLRAFCRALADIVIITERIAQKQDGNKGQVQNPGWPGHDPGFLYTSF